jgi:hypothetical protein
MFNQRAIDFPPLGNPWILGLASAEVLRPDQVDELDRAAEHGFEDASAPMPEPLLQWCRAIAQANSEYFRFDLEGVLEPGEPVLRELGSGESLLDCGLERDNSTRKLVSLLILSVTGDEVRLRMEDTGSEVSAVPGSFVTFPAYAAVSCQGPPDCRVRFLLAHAVGPAFR